MTHLKLLPLILLAALVSASPANASNTYIPADLEDNLVTICKALKTNKTFKLRRAIKSAHLSKTDVTNNLVCNGMGAIDFALSENARKSAAYLVGEAVLAKRNSNAGSELTGASE